MSVKVWVWVCKILKNYYFHVGIFLTRHKLLLFGCDIPGLALTGLMGIWGSMRSDFMKWPGDLATQSWVKDDRCRVIYVREFLWHRVTCHFKSEKLVTYAQLPKHFNNTSHQIFIHVHLTFAFSNSILAFSNSILAFPDSILSFSNSILAFTNSILVFSNSILAFPDSILSFSNSILAFTNSILVFSNSILAFLNSILAFPDSILAFLTRYSLFVTDTRFF